MLRPDESAAWNGFLAAEPEFAGEGISTATGGPDPPDVLCMTETGRTIGIELTKWVEHDQVASGRAREAFERSYLEIVASENEPRPEKIGWVWLHPKSQRVKRGDAAQFRSELYYCILQESREQNPEWDTPQGGPITDFARFPFLAKYLSHLWLFPRHRLENLPLGLEWIMFSSPGGAYTPEWMVQAAIDRICSKVEDYAPRNVRGRHALAELDLLCYYCDEALLHNTPTEAPGFSFTLLASKVAQGILWQPLVFDRIFLFNPYEHPQVIRVYPHARVATRMP